MGRNLCLELLITCVMLTTSCSAQQEGNATGSSSEIDQMWNDFKLKYGKSYGSESEEQKRKEIFIENLNKTNAQNDLYANGQSSFTAGINQFHDLTQSEFVAKTTCSFFNSVFDYPNTTIHNDNSRKFPRNIDWRKKRYVTPVKNQGQCRACWAFATDGPCRYQPNAVGATCNGFGSNRGEIKLQAAVADVGPVASTIFVSESLRTYNGGIFDDDTCTGDPGHAMLIVGYATDPSTKLDYWIVKNSFGTTWGENGYAFIVRNKEMCGIGRNARYPILIGDELDSGETSREDL